MVRWIWLVGACGDETTPTTGNVPEPTTDTTDTYTPPPPPPEPTCEPTGVTSGCIVQDIDCVSANTALNGTPGGWFSDLLGESIIIDTASSPAGLAIEFTIFGPRVLTPGEIVTWPMEMSATLTDTSLPDTTVVWHACSGTLIIDAYVPNESISVSWEGVEFENSDGLGVCSGYPGFWRTEGTMSGASFCVE